MPTMSGTCGRTSKSGRGSTKTQGSSGSKRNVDAKVLQSTACSPWDGLALRQQATPSAVHKLKQHPYPVYLDIEAKAQQLGDGSGSLEEFDSRYVEGFGAQFEGERIKDPPSASFAGSRAPASRDVSGIGGSKDLLFPLQNDQKSLSRISAKSTRDLALLEARKDREKNHAVGSKSESSRRARKTPARLSAYTTQQGYRNVPGDDEDAENDFGHSSSYVMIPHDIQR